MRFPRQEYWSGLPIPPPGDFPDSGIEPASPALAGRFFTTEPLRKPPTKKVNWKRKHGVQRSGPGCTGAFDT